MIINIFNMESILYGNLRDKPIVSSNLMYNLIIRII